MVTRKSGEKTCNPPLTRNRVLIDDNRRNPTTKAIFTGGIQPTSTDKGLLGRGDKAEALVLVLHDLFQDGHSRYQLRANSLAPLFGDGHFFDPATHRQFFLELKEGQIRVSQGHVEHGTAAFGGTGQAFFTWRHSRDLLLSIPENGSGSFALLIPWEKIPWCWKENGYTDGRIAQASRGEPDYVGQYLLPWPDTVHERRRALHASVAERLDIMESRADAPGWDYLRRLLRHPIEEVGANEKTVTTTTPASECMTDSIYAFRAALALHSILVKRYVYRILRSQQIVDMHKWQRCHSRCRPSLQKLAILDLPPPFVAFGTRGRGG